VHWNMNTWSSQTEGHKHNLKSIWITYSLCEITRYKTYGRGIDGIAIYKTKYAIERDTRTKKCTRIFWSNSAENDRLRIVSIHFITKLLKTKEFSEWMMCLLLSITFIIYAWRDITVTWFVLFIRIIVVWDMWLNLEILLDLFSS